VARASLRAWFWDGKEDQLVEMEILKTRNFPAEAMDGDGMWEEKARQTREEGERRKIGRWWVDGEGDQMMNDKAGNADNMSESGSEDDKDHPDEVEA
jgi:hypothetical protein